MWSPGRIFNLLSASDALPCLLSWFTQSLFLETSSHSPTDFSLLNQSQPISPNPRSDPVIQPTLTRSSRPWRADGHLKSSAQPSGSFSPLSGSCPRSMLGAHGPRGPLEGSLHKAGSQHLLLGWWIEPRLLEAAAQRI